MPPQEVDKIAQGRVWAGITAKEIGLVDGIGNLQDAVGSAAELAKLTDYEVVYVKQPLTAREEMIRRLNRFLAGIFSDIWGSSVSPAVRMYRQIGNELEPVMELNDPKGLYAYCLTCDLN
jgi:protease-4